MAKIVYEKEYKTFKLKDLQGKSGQMLYGFDKNDGEFGCELLVFEDNEGNCYLIAENYLDENNDSLN